jgi:hypothetical protein
MSDTTPADRDRGRDRDGERSSGSPLAAGLMGLLVGALVVLVLVWVFTGNPFSDVNEIEYIDTVVAQASEDRLCWATDPGRRDAPLACGILALDPSLPVPDEGDLVTIGFVELDPPDGASRTQVVYVAEAAAEAALAPSSGLD